MFDSTGFELEDLERVGRDAENEIRRLAEIEAELGDVRGTGTGADGLITVTVDGSGRVEGIDLNPRVMRLDSHTLAAELMKAIGKAGEDGERRVREILEDAGLSAAPPDLDEAREQMTVAYESFARAVDGLSGR
ncbi:YbaB/EbfC family nucleoid-associated protein [Streptosporangium carneum]|uniref:YbaB/EbfC family nucleoid-associated protein n=1 Tax=Streptosporangium carneum TaxID=47481 RepID=UPI0022F2D3F2|nr:YbaB/EbfC family nucleoid-associated protein [Streptosporangium carneum]